MHEVCTIFIDSVIEVDGQGWFENLTSDLSLMTENIKDVTLSIGGQLWRFFGVNLQKQCFLIKHKSRKQL